MKPTYLLKNIPENIRQKISEEAHAQSLSLSDVVRQALCASYPMECEHTGYYYDWKTRTDSLNSTLLIRFQPRLFRALAKEAQREERSIREVILSRLAGHYGETL